MEHSREHKPELDQILEAERQGRTVAEEARAEAARIEEEARRLAAERLEAARMACAARRAEAHAVTVERAEAEVSRIRTEAHERCQGLAALARRGADAAADAAEAALLGEE